MFNLQRHYEHLVYYASLFFEIIISGFFVNLDGFYFFTRLGIFFVSFAVIEKRKLKALPWVGFIIVILSSYGLREKYQKIETEKFFTLTQKEITKVIKPEKPLVANCENVFKWERQSCNSGNLELQRNYQKDLASYNSKILISEKTIKELEVELTFYDLLPLYLYVLLISTVSWLAVVSASNPGTKNKKVVTDKKVLALSDYEKVKLIYERNKKEKITQKTLCEEYGISLSDYKRKVNSFGLKPEPISEPLQNFGLEGTEENFA